MAQAVARMRAKGVWLSDDLVSLVLKRAGGRVVSQKGMEYLAAQIHRHTMDFPRKELYGLVSQMRRYAVGIPSNIAEGYARGGKDFARFVSMGYGSLLVETQ